MTNADAELITRIAVALERQVEQHDEAVARSLKMRDENIERHNRERDQELKEARESNDKLFAILDDVMAKNARILALYESHPLVDAVGEAQE